jgi:hypothetical protein
MSLMISRLFEFFGGHLAFCVKLFLQAFEFSGRSLGVTWRRQRLDRLNPRRQRIHPLTTRLSVCPGSAHPPGKARAIRHGGTLSPLVLAGTTAPAAVASAHSLLSQPRRSPVPGAMSSQTPSQLLAGPLEQLPAGCSGQARRRAPAVVQARVQQIQGRRRPVVRASRGHRRRVMTASRVRSRRSPGQGMFATSRTRVRVSQG